MVNQHCLIPVRSSSLNPKMLPITLPSLVQKEQSRRFLDRVPRAGTNAPSSSFPATSYIDRTVHHSSFLAEDLGDSIGDSKTSLGKTYDVILSEPGDSNGVLSSPLLDTDKKEVSLSSPGQALSPAWAWACTLEASSQFQPQSPPDNLLPDLQSDGASGRVQDTHVCQSTHTPVAREQQNSRSGAEPGLEDTMVFLDDLDVVADVGVNLVMGHDDTHVSSPEPCQCCGLPRGSCPFYIQSMVELAYQLGVSGVPNRDGLRIPYSHSTLDVAAWQMAIKGYFDEVDVIESLRFGWDLSLVGVPTPKDAVRNHPSAINNFNDTQLYIDTELAHGCLVGPILSAPFKVFCSPLGSVPKTGSSSRRTITDCSNRGKGINAFIPKQMYRGSPYKIKLPGIDDLIGCISKTRAAFPGQRIVGFKMDLSRYYRNLFVDLGQACYLGVRWDNKVYMDIAFGFGNRAAMGPAQKMSEALAWYFRTKVPPDGFSPNSGLSCVCLQKCSCGDNYLVPYVDDLGGIALEKNADYLWNTLLDTINSLGLSPSATPGHLCPPSSSFVFLGVLFDLDKNTISIPPEKLQKISLLVLSWMDKTEASLKELQQLLGSLLNVSRVIRSGRLFVARMLDSLRRAYHIRVVPLDASFRSDLLWWAQALESWNGVSYLEFHQFSNCIALDASTDGWWSGSPGVGGFNFVSNQFFKTGVPTECQGWHIADLELLGHLICIHLWGSSFRGYQIYGLTDSEPCEWFLRNGRSRIDVRLRMGRTICFLEHEWGFQWIPGGIRSAENVL